MNVYKILGNLLAAFLVLILMPAFLLLPRGIDMVIMPVFLVVMLACGLLLMKAREGVVYDERTLRINGTANTFAMVMVIACATILGVLPKFGINVELPIASIIIIYVSVLSGRGLFEVMVRLPNAEGR